MLKAEREAEILRLLIGTDGGILRVSQLSDALAVSEMTIRRDLESLEERGLVRRVHGGAMHVSNTLLLEKSFNDRGREYNREKAVIGRLAASLVSDGDVVILDAGTTTLQVARHLEARHLTVVTNALPVATELAGREGVSAILLGGNLKGPELCTVGPIATESLSQMAADTVFLSCAGFSAERGLTDPDLREAEVKRAMMRASRRAVLVADSSKYGSVSFAHIAGLESLQVLVTDAGLSPEARQALQARGVRVMAADPASPESAPASAAARAR
jgi:DeoR family transcriptional regulator, fructose operon transcriptional repressor